MQIKTGKSGKFFHWLKIIVKNKFFGYPYLAIVETGNMCNIHCATCPTPHERLARPKMNMGRDEFKKIIDNIKNDIHVVLLYNTNEPLLNPYLPEMIKYADRQNLYIMISTNAMLLNEAKRKEILESGLDEIIVCLDGTTKESYEAFRVGADFATVYENIKSLCFEKKNGGYKKPFIELQFILNRLNQDQVPEIKKLAAEWGVDRLHIKSFSLGEYAYTKDEIRELGEKFLPTTEQYGKVIYSKNAQGTLDIRRKRDASWYCRLARDQAIILVDGRLSMCCYDIKGEYIYGNLLQNDLKSLWFDKEVMRKRMAAESGKYPLCEVCSEY
jgi:MoaA/NifB/PqqE/SkfB family radical SAM enzyme